jgi:hypothetical protein
MAGGLTEGREVMVLRKIAKILEWGRHGLSLWRESPVICVSVIGPVDGLRMSRE